MVAVSLYDWNKGEKDYVPCGGTDAVPCKVEGILHTLEAELCRAHMKAFYDMGADVIPSRKPEWIKHAKCGQQTDFTHGRPKGTLL